MYSAAASSFIGVLSLSLEAILPLSFYKRVEDGSSL
jgi:hypothetical protein